MPPDKVKVLCLFSTQKTQMNTFIGLNILYQTKLANGPLKHGLVRVVTVDNEIWAHVEPVKRVYRMMEGKLYQSGKGCAGRLGFLKISFDH